MVVANFDQAYFFGDSLSDTGNVFEFTFPNSFPNTPYAPGRFSNGDIWVDNLTNDLGINTSLFSSSPNVNNSVNYNFGGATSGTENVGVVPIGLQQQLDKFNELVETQGSEETFKSDLFFLWAGANDYFSFIQDDPTTPDVIETNFPQRGKETINAILEVVDINIKGGIQDIIDAGGQNIVLFNLPDLDKTPLGQSLTQADQRKLRKLTHKHNQRLDNLATKTEVLNPDVNIIEIDVNQLFDDIMANPSQFGLSNVTDNFTGIDLYTGSSQPPAAGDPNQYFFFDSVHPTTTVHDAITDLVSEQLINEGLII
jgi:phospholipase/lecithinase/hemolysin